MKEYIVETKSLKKYYQMGENTVKALDGVDFRVKAREFVAIIGKSGSGKSTLLHMLGGLDEPTDGSVLIDGKILSGLKKEQLAILRRRKIGFIFQNYNLVPDLNVYENVVLPVELDGRKVDEEYVSEILELLGLSKKKDAFPGNLSGGQQQRLCIARAMAVSPSVLLMDEPASALDPISTAKVEELIHELKKDYTIVIVTHNMQQAARVSDKTAFFYLGEMVEYGDTKRIFTNPEKVFAVNIRNLWIRNLCTLPPYRKSLHQILSSFTMVRRQLLTVQSFGFPQHLNICQVNQSSN